MELTHEEWIALLTLAFTQAVTLIGIGAGVFVSINNGRQLAHKADKKDVEEIHKLVNGKTAKLERLIEERAFKAGVEEGKSS